jgi:hypothetical protein
MTTALSRPSEILTACPAARRRRAALRLGFGALVLIAPDIAATARPGAENGPPSCYRTAGGALEICRDGSEAEGVLAAPPACSFARGVQLVRLPRNASPGPFQAVFQGESPQAGGRRGEACSERRATDTRDGGTLRTGRSPEQLAMILPPAESRFGVPLPAQRERRRGVEVPAAATEGIGPRSPITVSGRDWAGEEYFYVFMLGQEPVSEAVATALTDEPRRRPRRRETAEDGGGLRRRVQIEARTLDFVHFEIRTRVGDGDGQTWTPAGEEGTRRRSAPVPATVLDRDGKPIVSACTAAPFDTHGLAGSISIVERTYHYFYTDVLPEDCGLPPEKRRTGLYLRTSTDLAADRVWSAPRRLGEALPPGSLVRVARAKDAARWAISYTCYRPANAPGGPVADICLQYTADLDPAGIGALSLFSEPLEAARSPAYLGLRSGGDGAGRFDRSAHFWMTDSHGNLDVPGTYAGKSGLLTWVDRLAPGAGGAEGSSVYGRPVYWATWTVRRTGNP